MDKIFKQVSNIVDLLVLRKFDELESITKGNRLTALQLEDAVNGYGRTLVKLPPESIGLIDVVKVDSCGVDKWSIVSPLWTKEEGRSDLSIEITLIDDGDSFITEIDDIHVL